MHEWGIPSIGLFSQLQFLGIRQPENSHFREDSPGPFQAYLEDIQLASSCKRDCLYQPEGKEPVEKEAKQTKQEIWLCVQTEVPYKNNWKQEGPVVEWELDQFYKWVRAASNLSCPQSPSSNCRNQEPHTATSRGWLAVKGLCAIPGPSAKEGLNTDTRLLQGSGSCVNHHSLTQLFLSTSLHCLGGWSVLAGLGNSWT